MVVDRPRRGRAARRSRALRRPSASSASTSSSRAREAGRVLPRRRPRPARDSARAALAQPPGDDRGRRRAPEPLQLVERPPERLLLVGIRERERRLVRAAELAPQLGRPRPLARRAAARTAPPTSAGISLVEAGAPSPAGELADEPAASARRASSNAASVAVERRLAVALEPRDLGSRGRHRPEPLQLAGRLGQGPRLVERRPRARVAAARAHEPEDRRARRCAAWSRCGGCAGRLRRTRPPPPSGPGRARCVRDTRAGRAARARARARCSTRARPRGSRPRARGGARGDRSADEHDEVVRRPARRARPRGASSRLCSSFGPLLRRSQTPIVRERVERRLGVVERSASSSAALAPASIASSAPCAFMQIVARFA